MVDGVIENPDALADPLEFMLTQHETLASHLESNMEEPEKFPRKRTQEFSKLPSSTRNESSVLGDMKGLTQCFLFQIMKSSKKTGGKTSKLGKHRDAKLKDNRCEKRLSRADRRRGTLACGSSQRKSVIKGFWVSL